MHEVESIGAGSPGVDSARQVRPSIADVARTLRVLCGDIVPYAVRMGLHDLFPQPYSTTQAGLAEVRASFSATLRRLGVDLEVLHDERVRDQPGGVVLMWNQETHLDHLVLASAIPRPFFSLFNNAIARTPFYGAHMRRSGHVHVDRTDETQWRPAVALAAERVRAGECVLVSPEGTRSRDGRLLPMKRCALILALASGAPVVCTTVIGGHLRMPRGSPIVRSGPMRVVFSEPILVEALGGDDTRAAAELAERMVQTFEATKRKYAVLR